MFRLSREGVFGAIEALQKDKVPLYRCECAKLDDLIGKTIIAICMPKEEDIQDVIIFACLDGSAYAMYYEQDCCETVEIEDICGDLDILEGSPLTRAEVRTSSDGDENDAGPKDERWDESHTWTFYTFATAKGYVDIRWYGTSNGYYSESVDFVKIR